MSLGDAYTLGVRLTGDIAGLRQELAAGAQLVSQFSNASVEALNRAATALEQSAAGMQAQASRTTRSNKTRADSFTEYMRRVEAAEKQAAKASRDSADEVERSATRTKNSLSGVAGTLGRVAGFGGLAVLSKQVWDLGLGFNEFQQNSTIALENLLGGAAKARTFLADILTFAKQTPYAFTDLTDQAQKLLSYGFDAEQIIPILTAVGDAATLMGKGTEGVERLSRALGQINAKGRLQSEELLQLNEIGINGLAILANQAGVTTLEYQKMVTAGLIPAEQAIDGLVKGINEGTTGINGTTAAFGGFMAQVKESGGITATIDSFRTSMRNAAGEVTKTFIPAFLDLVRTVQGGLGFVEKAARWFGELPGPVQSTALALSATAVAMRLLNVQGRAQAAWLGARALWRTYQANVGQAMDRQAALGRQVNVNTARMVVFGAATKSALLGAFGGPVGLAIVAVTTAVTAFAAAAADAKARADSYAQAVEEVGDRAQSAASKIAIENLISGDNADWGWFQKWQSGYDSAADAVEGLGLSLEEVGKTIVGPRKEFDAYIAMLEEMHRTADSKDWNALDEIRVKVLQQRSAFEQAQKAQEQRARAGTADAEATEASTDAITQNISAMREWSDEQQKSIDSATESARKASQAAFGTLDLNLSTEDDLAAAREKVAEATRKVRNEEADREDTYSRKKVSANDKVKADEAVTEARKSLASATSDLRDVEARRDPVAQYRKQVQSIIDETRSFNDDMKSLVEQGLNSTDLAALYAAGPEASAEARKALLGDPSLVDFTNEARTTIDALSSEIAAQAKVNQSALEAPGLQLGANLLLGMQVAAKEGSASTIQEIANALGQDPQRIYNVGQQFGLSFLAGFSDASQFQPLADGSFRVPGGPTRGYATGGIFPGYTPGRDVGYIGVSGGEAIMRPEWTRAVGPDFVHMMNRIARTAGVGGVREAMGRYLGGFANGGIPQVVTVPVSSTHERYSPVTVQKAYVVDAGSLGLYGDRTRQQRNIFGGNRG
ncbi:tape measure protein [Cellulomonas sp.]|uniref:tape measure protein n=1 Tax=Cellulomonas sp. TaxID=40001 RepID=UPI001B13CB91|nr:tape measure protein [Cellulomonas sp.]MBO9555613.1 tape measure protein [Cellulomonas sp.]